MVAAQFSARQTQIVGGQDLGQGLHTFAVQWVQKLTSAFKSYFYANKDLLPLSCRASDQDQSALHLLVPFSVQILLEIVACMEAIEYEELLEPVTNSSKKEGFCCYPKSFIEQLQISQKCFWNAGW